MLFFAIALIDDLLGQRFADLLHHLFGQRLVPAGRAEHKFVLDER